MTLIFDPSRSNLTVPIDSPWILHISARWGWPVKLFQTSVDECWNNFEIILFHM